MKSIMLDLETMGNGPESAIIAIGAVYFDISTNTIIDKFYEVVDLESSLAQGGKITASTVMWWLQQSEGARDQFKRPSVHIQLALMHIANWLSQIGPKAEIEVWGNGAAFDNVILKSAFERAKLEVPWEFWNDRCYRTMRALWPNIKVERVGTYHNALDDATTQAVHLMAILNNACSKV